MLKKIITISALCALFLVTTLGVLILANGFPYEYMDLNDSGFVSPREAMRTLDMGIREVNIEGKECIEVFALKDALPIKQICSET